MDKLKLKHTHTHTHTHTHSLSSRPGRPRLGARMLVRKRLFRLVPDAIRAATDWSSEVRSRAIQLLEQLVIHAESACVAQLAEITTAIVKANRDEDAAVRAAALAVARRLGEVIDCSILMAMVLPMAGVVAQDVVDIVRVKGASMTDGGGGGDGDGDGETVGPKLADALGALGSTGTAANHSSAAAIAAEMVRGARPEAAVAVAPAVIRSISALFDPAGAAYPTDGAHRRTLSALLAALASVAVDAGAMTLPAEFGFVRVFVATHADAPVVCDDGTAEPAPLAAAVERVAAGSEIVLVEGSGAPGQTRMDESEDAKAYPGPAGSVRDLVARHTPEMLASLLRDVPSWRPGGHQFECNGGGLLFWVFFF
jgi:hypothetical protein